MAPAIHGELRLAPAIRAALDGLRRRIREYVWVDGLAAAVAWLGAAFWLSLATDWLFEPPKSVRGAVVAAAAIGLAVVLVRRIVRRAFVRLSDSNMAMLLERRFPQLGDCLLTAVVLAARMRPGRVRPGHARAARAARRPADRRRRTAPRVQLRPAAAEPADGDCPGMRDGRLCPRRARRRWASGRGGPFP